MFKKLVLVLMLLTFSNSAFAVDQWLKAKPAGSDNASDIDTLIQANNSALDRMTNNYRRDCTVIPSSSTQVTILPCEIMICNSGSSLCVMRQTTTNTTVSWADIDTGAEASTTQYYVYVTADTDIAGFVEKISTSSSAPSGMTKYRKIGYFYNNSSGDIVDVGNIKGGDVFNTMQAIGTSNISTSSSSYSDMTDMTVQFVSSGRPVRIDWQGSLDVSSHANVNIMIDGSQKIEETHANKWWESTSGYAFVSTVSYLDTTLSAGAHTIKVQWKTDSSATQNGSSDGARTLIVEEL